MMYCGELMNRFEHLKVDITSLHERELIVTVPKEMVKSEFQSALKKVQRVAKRPGFRPGKMPESMVWQFFGGDIKKETISNLVDASFDDACKHESLIPVSKPALTPVAEPEMGKPFIYKAAFQVKPKVEVTHYQGLAVEFKNFTFSEEDVQHEIENLADSHATFKEPEHRDSIESKDLVSCHTHVSIDGVPSEEYSHKDYSVPLFADNVPEDLKNALMGKKVGEEAVVKYTMPADHQDETLKGKECEMVLHIESFKERILPVLDDEFAKDVSEAFKSLDELKESIRTRFTIMAKRRNEYYRQEALTRALVEKNPLEIPSALVERMAISLINREMSNMQKDVAERLVKDHWQEVWKSVQVRAEFRVKTELLFEELIKTFDIKISEEDVAKRVSEVDKLSKEDAEYSIKVEKLLHAIEACAKVTRVDEALFKGSEDAHH